MNVKNITLLIACVNYRNSVVIRSSMSGFWSTPRDDVPYEKTYALDRDQIGLLSKIPGQVEFVNSILEKVVDRVCASRCTISVRPCEKESANDWTDSDLNQLFDDQLYDFERGVIRMWAQHGFAIGQYTYRDGVNASSRNPKDVKINLLNPALYEVRWNWTNASNVRYRVYPLLREKPGMSPLETSDTKNHDLRTELENTFVIPFADFNPHSSAFLSSLMKQKQTCASLRIITTLRDVGILRQVFPLTVKKFDSTGYKVPLESVTPEILTALNSGITDAGNTRFSETEVYHAVESASRRGISELLRTMDDDPKNSSAKINEYFAALDPFSPTLKSDLLRLVGKDPLKPTYTLIPGVSLDPAAPESRLPSEILAIIEQLEDSIREGFDLPSEKGSTQITAGVVKSETQYNVLVSKYRKKLEKVIRNLFLDIYGICFTDMKDHYPAITRDRTLAKVPKFVNLKEKKQTAKGKLVKEESRERSYRVSLTRKYGMLFENSIIVGVTYSPTTSTDLADVVVLYQIGALNFEAFQKLALSAARIPLSAHLKLTPEEYKKLDKKKLKELMTSEAEKQQQQQQQKQQPSKLEQPKRKPEAELPKQSKKTKLPSSNDIAKKESKKEQVK